MTTPNWAHNSGKDKKSRGTCKGRLKARKQALRALLRKIKRDTNPASSVV